MKALVVCCFILSFFYQLLPLTEAVAGVRLSIAFGQAAIRVDWDKPSSDLPIIRYDVQYMERGAQWMAPIPVQGAYSLTTTITNLQRGTTYVVRVRPVFSKVGDYTLPDDQPDLILPSLSPKVTGVKVSVISGQATIRVNWTNATIDGTFIRYEVQYKTSSQSWDAPTIETVVDQNVVTVDLKNLQRGTTYNVRVRAVSNAGNSPYSAEATSTVDFDGAVIGIIMPDPGKSNGRQLAYTVLSNNSVNVSWSEPQHLNGSLVGYNVTYSVLGATTITTEEGFLPFQSVTLTGLAEGTPYEVNVRANSYGNSSSIVLFASELVPQTSPSNLTASWKDESSVFVTWEPIPLHEARGFPLYVVHLQEIDTENKLTATIQANQTNSCTTVVGSLNRLSSYLVSVEAWTTAGTCSKCISQPAFLHRQVLSTSSPPLSVDIYGGLLTAIFFIGILTGMLILVLLACVVYGLQRLLKSKATTLTKPLPGNRTYSASGRESWNSSDHIRMMPSPAYLQTGLLQPDPRPDPEEVIHESNSQTQTIPVGSPHLGDNELPSTSRQPYLRQKRDPCNFEFLEKGSSEQNTTDKPIAVYLESSFNM